MNIIQRTKPSDAPYMVADDNGTIVFWCNYKHEAEAFVRGVKYANRKQAQRDLFTDYENRFEVLEKGDSFCVFDHAFNVIVGGELFAEEEDADDFKESLIQEEQQQENYYTKSGR